MTKLELSKKLGILLDPESNRVDCDADVEAAIKDLVHSFAVQSLQSKLMGRVQKNLWLELLPWHSYN